EVIPPGEQFEVLRRRSAARDQVVERLLAGELSLTQAAAWVRYLNDNPPELRVYLYYLPRKSDGGKPCRPVIEWVGSYLLPRGTPQSQSRAALDPLEGELQRLLAEYDEIALPPVDQPGHEPEKR